ncbi:MAG: flagellar basal body-associated protein FliL [Pseudobdellovibrionaceae bacterium]
MADSKKGSEEPQKQAPISVAVEESFTDEDLDQVLSEEDPEFLKTVKEISQDKNLSLSQIVITDEDQILNEEKSAWENGGRLKKAIYRFFPFMPKLSLILKKWKFALFSFLRAEWVRSKNFLYFLATDGKQKSLQAVKKVLNAISDFLSNSMRNFKYLGWKLKVAVLMILIVAVGTGLFIYKSVTHGVLPQKDELFMPTLERVASEVKEYDPASETEPFYENLRAPSNILQLPKVVVNLRKSSQSGTNPMGAFEFFVEGMAPEVVIEIKDREVEIRDRVQRVLEEFSFDILDKAEGKKLVCEKLKKEINLLLTTGKVKKVWIKTVILKP